MNQFAVGIQIVPPTVTRLSHVELGNLEAKGGLE